MYSSFTVKNFRCFRDISIESLERVNLIAGENNVGKTALLEAFWLHHGANVPDLARRVNSFRGLDQIDVKELFWELFLGFDPSLRIELVSYGIWGEKPRSLQIYLQERESVEIPLGQPPGGEPTTQEKSSAGIKASRDEIIFEYTDEYDKTFTSRGWVVERQVAPTVVELGFQSYQMPIGKRPLGIYLAARHRPSGREDIERFSNMEVVGKQDDIVEILKRVDPNIKRLSVIVRSGVPVLHVDIGDQRLVPVPLLGDGMGRLLSVALAIGNAQDGIILVDEIENGLYHRTMVDVWKVIASFTRQLNVQLFATTHSEECIRAAHQAFAEDSKYDFHLHRLEHIEDTIRAVTYEKETLGAALESGLEIH
jgi:AAA15 family ATPase/GTPase